MSAVWDVCAWVGIVTLTVLAVVLFRGFVETFIVMRIGWTRLKKLGFWRSIPAAVRTRKWQR